MKAVVAVVVGLVALAGCSSDGSNKSASPTTTATTAPETTVGAGAPKAATNGGAATTGPTTTRPPDVSLDGFITPSGNIGCAMGPGGGRCDIRDHTWTAPPKPAECQLDYGDSIESSGSGVPTFGCHGDTVIIQGSTVLAYGQRSRQGSFVCDSEQAGVTCTNEATKHGFFMSRDSYRIF